jgi:hypothetical protein
VVNRASRLIRFNPIEDQIGPLDQHPEPWRNLGASYAKARLVAQKNGQRLDPVETALRSRRLLSPDQFLDIQEIKAGLP